MATYKLFQFDAEGERMGCIAPRILIFADKAEGEIVAARYRNRFKGGDFRVLPVNDLGYIVAE